MIETLEARLRLADDELATALTVAEENRSQCSRLEAQLGEQGKLSEEAEAYLVKEKEWSARVSAAEGSLRTMQLKLDESKSTLLSEQTALSKALVREATEADLAKVRGQLVDFQAAGNHDMQATEVDLAAQQGQAKEANMALAEVNNLLAAAKGPRKPRLRKLRIELEFR